MQDSNNLLTVRNCIRTVTVLLCIGGADITQAAESEHPYPNRAPLEHYAMDRNAEIALARTAAPEAISREAAIVVLGAHGYEDAVKGRNDFTCLVERAWGADFDDPEFWNPKNRSPICFNGPATRSVLVAYFKRTQWVLAGASLDEILQRTRAAVAAKEIVAPEPGAMTYMMSKQGYLSDRDGHWHPHVMFYLPRLEASSWGANVQGSQVYGGPLQVEPVSLFMVPVPNWSDGSPGPEGH